MYRLIDELGFSFLTGATGLILIVGGLLVLRRRSSERRVA